MPSDTSIDTRIVEMQFDNKNFEKGAKETLNTLDDLKKSLNFDGAEKGFKTLQNGINSITFKNLTDNVQTVANSFDTLAGRLKVNFFDRISNMILDTGKTLVNSTFGQIISGGKSRAMNIAQSKFKLEGMGVKWEEIADDIDYAVSGTAYGLDAAATIAAQLTASGIKVGDDMKAALRGVSGVAAMTSSSYEEIGQVFAAVAGQGRLMGMQLQQLSLRGINAAATLAEQLGLTEAEVRELVSKGEIDFMTFATAMDNAFGEHAKDANKTFTGALSNVKAALSRLGEIFYDPLYNHAIMPLNQLREMIAEFVSSLKTAHGDLKPFSEAVNRLLWHLSGVATILLRKMNPALKTLETHTMPMIGKHIDSLASSIRKVRIFLRKDSGFLDSTGSKIVAFIRLISSAFNILSYIMDAAIMAIYDFRDSANGLSYFGDVMTSIVNTISDIARNRELLRSIFELSYATTTIILQALSLVYGTIADIISLVVLNTPIISNVISILSGVINIVSDVILRVADAFAAIYNKNLLGSLNDHLTAINNMVGSFRVSDLFISKLVGVLQTLFTILQAVGSAIAAVGSGLIFGLYTILSTVVTFIANNLGLFADFGKALIAVGGVLVDIIKTIISAAEEVFGMAIGSLITAAIYGVLGLVKLLAALAKRAKIVTKFIKPVVDIIASLFYILRDVVNILRALFRKDSSTEDVMSAAAESTEAFGKSMTTVGNTAPAVSKAIFKIQDAAEVLGKVFERLTGLGLGDWLFNIVDKFKSFQKTFTIDSIADGVGNAVDRIKTGLSNLKKIFNDSGIKTSLGTFVENIKDFKKEIFGENSGTLSTVSGSIGSDKKGGGVDIVMILTSIFEGTLEAITIVIDGWNIILRWVIDKIKDLKKLFGKARKDTDKAGDEGDGWLETIEETFNDNLKPHIGPLNLIRYLIKTELEKAFDFVDWLLEHLIAYIGLAQQLIRVLGVFNVSRGILKAGEGIKAMGYGYQKMAIYTGDFLGALKSLGTNFAKTQKLKAIAEILISFELFLVLLFGIIAGLTTFLTNASDETIHNFYVALTIVASTVIVSFIILGIFIATLHELSKNMDPDKANAIAKLMKAFSGSIMKLAFSFLLITFIAAFFQRQDLADAMMIFTELIVALGVYIALVVFALSKMDHLSSNRTVKALTALAEVMKQISAFVLKASISMALIAFTITALGWDTALAAFMFVGALILSVIAMIAMVAKFGKGSRNFKSILKSLGYVMDEVAKLFILSALAMGIIAMSIEGYGEETVRHARGLLVMMLMSVYAILALGNKFANFKHVASLENLYVILGRVGKLFLAMAASTLIMALAIKLMPENFVGASVTLGLFLAGMAGIIIAMFKLLNKTSFVRQKDLKSIGILFVVMAGVILVIASAINSIAFVETKQLAARALSIGLIFLALGSVIAGILYIAGSPEMLIPGWQTMLLGVGAAFVLMASTLLIISKALNSLQGVDSLKEKAASIILMLATFVGVLALLAVISQFTFGGAGLIAIAAAFVILSSSLWVLAKGLKELDDVEFDKITGELGNMCKLAGVMTLLGLSSIVLGAGIIVIGLACAIAALPMIGVAIALKKLEKVKYDKIEDGLGTLAGLAKSLALLGLACLVLGAGFAVLGTGLAAMIVPALIFIPIIKSISEILDILANKGPALLDSIDGLIKRMPDMAKAFGRSIVEFIKTTAEGVAEAAPVVSKAILAVISNVFATLFGSVGVMADAFIRFLVKILDVVANNIGPILKRVWIIITNSLEFLNKNAELLGYYAYSILANVIKGMLKAYSQNIGDISERFFDAIIATIYAIANLFSGENVSRFTDAVDELMNNIVDAFSSWAQTTGWGLYFGIGGFLVDAILAAFGVRTSDMARAVKELVTGPATYFGVAPSIIKAINDKVAPDEEDPEEAERILQEAKDKALEKYLKAQDEARKEEENRYNSINEYLDSYGKAQDDINDKTKKHNDELKDTAKTLSENAESLKKYFSELGTNIDINKIKSMLAQGFNTEEIKKYIGEGGNVDDALTALFSGFTPDDIMKQFKEGLPISDLLDGVEVPLDYQSMDWSKVYDTSGLEFPGAPEGIDEYSDAFNYDDLMPNNYDDIYDENGMLNMGDYSADYTRQVNTTVSAELGDRTNETLTALQNAVQDLQQLIYGGTFIKDGANINVFTNIDGETVANSVTPFVEARLAASAGSEGRHGS